MQMLKFAKKQKQA